MSIRRRPLSPQGTVRLDRPTMAEARAARLPFLHRVHPLSKLIPTTLALIAIFFVHDLTTPALVWGLSTLLLLSGAALSVRQALLLLVGMPVIAAVLAFTIGLWVDTELTVGTPVLFTVGAWEFRLGGLESGLVTALRLVAIVALALVGGLTTSGADVVRSAVQQLRVPYRLGYAGLAGLRFVPRFQRELRIIRQAQRARGVVTGRGPLGWMRRQAATLVPLMAAAMRHADRVALSMDARGFGYRSQRTERYPVPVRRADVLCAVLLVVAYAAAFVAGNAAGG